MRKVKTALTAKIASETQSAAVPKAAAERPAGKSTVSPTETTEAPIRPTTAGLRPDMQPPTIRLLRNLS